MHWFCAWLAWCATTLPVIPVAIDKTSYQLELAADPASREHGLMDRQKMGPHDGMLFVFPKPDSYRFWMKDTHLPLDIIFIDAHGVVAEIVHGEPESLVPVGRTAGIQAVIELDAGRAARDGVARGDHVTYALPDSVSVR